MIHNKTEPAEPYRSNITRNKTRHIRAKYYIHELDAKNIKEIIRIHCNLRPIDPVIKKDKNAINLDQT